MTNISVKTMEKPRLSIKAQVFATVASVAGAVALPQLLHMLGAVSGLGTALGEIFLPMHLPIILVGLVAGPYAGLVAGALGPVVSFALSGMPSLAMLPFMVVELAFYGLSAGLLRNVKLPTLGKVVVSQVAGRLVRAAAILFSFYVFNSQAISAAIIWNSVVRGLPGLVLQWSLLPLIVFWVENRKKNEEA